MENMNIENVAEEVFEKVEESIPAPVQATGDSTGKTILTTLITVGVIEGCKYLWKRIKNHKSKKNEVVKEEDDIETPIGDMPDEEDVK